jgi:hypothetical protein
MSPGLALALLGAALAAEPNAGAPVEVRRGFYVATDVGGFLTLGGAGGYSNLQLYLQLGAGYELELAGGLVLVPVGLQAGVGANARNCWVGLLSSGACSGVDTFALGFLEASTGALFRVTERLYLGPRLLLGATLLEPEPRPGLRLALGLGVAASLEYGTALEHFSVGVDLTYRLVLGPNISAIAIQPRVQYTF